MKKMFISAISYFVAFVSAMLVPTIIATALPVQYWPPMCVLSGWFLAPVVQQQVDGFLSDKFLK